MVNLITDNIDIWTSAQIQKSNGGRGRSNGSANQTSYGIKKLRELILELAVRGKLVPHDPNDEPASVLLKKITEEKARLIKEGKIRKQKPLPEITENEGPAILPIGWVVERLQNTSWFITKGATPTTYGYQYSNSGVRFVKVENIENGRIITDGKSQYIDQDAHNFLERSKLENSDVLFSIAGTIGKTCIVYEEDLPANTNQALAIIRGYSSVFVPKFLLLQLDSFVSNKTKEKARGGAMNNVSLGDLNELVLHIPPLAEQHRIVAKVDELMALCDQLEQQQTNSEATYQILVKTLLTTLTTAANPGEFSKAWQRIANHFDTLFTTEQSIDQLKQTILQLAVMGKLVPQDPNDEPASVLLEKIAKEKVRLIKEGKIKKQKPLPSIADDEIPFELPESWEWTRLGVLGHTQTGTTPSTAKSEYFGKGDPFIKPADITDRGVVYDGDELTEAGMAVGRLIPSGSALMVCIGGSIGKVGYVDRVVSCNQQINTITPFARIDVVFLAYWLKSLLIQKQVLSLAPQTTLPILSKGKWELLLFPLPPLAEQHRIVAKVDELMALCDVLKTRLKEAQTTQIHLADTIVEQAVA